jgi:polar amino acid transport system ATP-binding protein
MNLAIHDLVQQFVDPRSGTQATVLDGLDLETGDIQALVLVGPSGGGKSTLLRILAGLDVPTAGTVAFDGEPLPRSEEGLISYRRTVGTVFQAYNLFPHRLREPLERFGLAAHAHKRPAELSGGQKQRVAILRALVVKPRRLFLDEPTSALDPDMTGEVLDMIGELKATGTQFVLVTHEMGFARHVADEIAFIADGDCPALAAPERFFEGCGEPRVVSFLERTKRP